MSQHGKRYRAARDTFDREQAYSPLEAVRLVKDIPAAKFDETVEAHFRLGLNVRHADQQLRGTIMLPHGIGKDVRVAVFAEGEKAREAEDAGADVVGSADLATKIDQAGRLPDHVHLLIKPFTKLALARALRQAIETDKPR